MIGVPNSSSTFPSAHAQETTESSPRLSPFLPRASPPLCLVDGADASRSRWAASGPSYGPWVDLAADKAWHERHLFLLLFLFFTTPSKQIPTTPKKQRGRTTGLRVAATLLPPTADSRS